MTAIARDLDLCLEPLTVLDCDAERQIEIAAETGCAFLNLWVQPPSKNFPLQCLVQGRERGERVRRRLTDCDVTLLGLEVFELRPDVDIPSFRPALELGAAIGARSATTIFGGESGPEQRLDQFIEFCQLAAEFGLHVHAEFISYRSLATLTDAVDLLEQAGQSNTAITIDLLHLVRSGGTIGQLRSLARHRIGHAQLCDGPPTMEPAARMIEAGTNRLLPGEGSFPVRAFVEALPPMPLGLEVPPGSDAFQGLDPLDRVRKLVKATRETLART